MKKLFFILFVGLTSQVVFGRSHDPDGSVKYLQAPSFYFDAGYAPTPHFPFKYNAGYSGQQGPTLEQNAGYARHEGPILELDFATD